MSLEEADILELKDRYDFLSVRFVQLCLKLAPEVKQMGIFRNELVALTQEFARRGVKHQDKESLIKLLEEAINEKTDSPESNSESE